MSCGPKGGRSNRPPEEKTTGEEYGHDRLFQHGYYLPERKGEESAVEGGRGDSSCVLVHAQEKNYNQPQGGNFPFLGDLSHAEIGTSLKNKHSNNLGESTLCKFWRMWLRTHETHRSKLILFEQGIAIALECKKPRGNTPSVTSKAHAPAPAGESREQAKVTLAERPQRRACRKGEKKSISGPFLGVAKM